MLDFEGGDHWEFGLFEFGDDVPTCIVDGLFCAPCTSAVQLSRVEDEEGLGAIPVLGHLFCTPCFMVHTRRQIRRRYLIKGGIFEDILTTICCTPCSVTQQACQMSRKGDKPCQVLMHRGTARSILSQF